MTLNKPVHVFFILGSYCLIYNTINFKVIFLNGVPFRICFGELVYFDEDLR